MKTPCSRIAVVVSLLASFSSLAVDAAAGGRPDGGDVLRGLRGAGGSGQGHEGAGGGFEAGDGAFQKDLRRIVLVDIEFGTREGRTLTLPRITITEKEQAAPLLQLGWTLPEPPPQRIRTPQLPASA